TDRRGGVLVQRLAHAEGVLGEEQRIAVGRRVGDVIPADVAVAAGPVLHDHRLAERLAQLAEYLPRHGIGGAAGNEGHHQPDRPIWKTLRERGTERTEQSDGNETAPNHCRSILRSAMTSRHFAISRSMKLFISSGLDAPGSPPSSTKRWRASAFASALRTSAFRRSISSRGV